MDTLSVLILFIFVIIAIFAKDFIPPKNNENMMIPLSPEQKKIEMTMVYDSINEAINKSLYNYVIRDITFGENSKVNLFISGHYRDLISYLLRPDVTFDDNGEEKSFLNYFINRVYILYISETSPYVKNLLFKYYSGFSPDTYFTRTKKNKPSALFFVSEYVKNDLLKRFNENEIIQAEYYNRMQNNNENVDKMTGWLKDYDMKCVCKLSLNIYNVNGITENISYSNKTKNEVNNELSSKHNEQS